MEESLENTDDMIAKLDLNSIGVDKEAGYEDGEVGPNENRTMGRHNPAGNLRINHTRRTIGKVGTAMESTGKRNRKLARNQTRSTRPSRKSSGLYLGRVRSGTRS